MPATIEKAVCYLGRLGWNAFQAANRLLPESESIHPDWAPAPLPKSRERSRPPLGWPRVTDSLCPRCVIETRAAILRGRRNVNELMNRHPGEIKAIILEENGEIKMRKTCARHGTFEDVLSIDPGFFHVIEARHPGRDIAVSGDEHVRRHGASTIRYGRGTVLTIDLTNRCNMMCEPCFMSANQVGYVHELTFAEVQRILDDAISFRPRRQMSVQFSGGEPTLSPYFLDACRYAHEVGYYQVQAATNGLRFAQDRELAFLAREAGLDMAYLQLDGMTNEANRHRKITNLFDAKLRAIENMYAAGINIVPVTTVVNTINDDQVGPILEFVLENSETFGGISFQPISFTGRDEGVSDEERHRKRYTLSHLALDLQEHFEGKIDPYRDWFPLGSMTSFAALADHLRGTGTDFGGLNCSCHPDCGASVMLAVNHRTGAWAPVTQFFDVDRFVDDIDSILDTSRGYRTSVMQTALSMTRNFKPSEAPAGMDLETFVGLFNRKLSGAMRRGKKAELDAWKLQWVGGMWFQDLWNYDFRRTEMCVIPYGTQEGEISFCAYNSGVGWRQIVENIHKVATTPEWYRTHGRHIIYAGDRAIPPSDPCPSPHTAVISGRRAAASAETPAKEATS